MHEQKKAENQRAGVDTDLIRFFLEMTPEQRLAANDNAVRAIEELKSGFRKAKPAAPRSECADKKPQ